MEKASAICKVIKGKLLGEDTDLHNVSSLQQANKEHMSFVLFPKDSFCAKKSKAGCIVLDREAFANIADNLMCSSFILVDDCVAAFKDLYASQRLPSLVGVVHKQEISLGAQVSHNAVVGQCVIGKNSVISPYSVLHDNVVIGQEVFIGAGTIIHSNALIEDGVTISANSVVGSQAFTVGGQESAFLVPNFGGVILRKNCFIGPLSNIAKGLLGNTEIGENSFLDSMVQVGHDVVIGSDVIIAAQAAIAGFCHIKKQASIGGQSGIAPFCTIGHASQVSAQAGVHKSVKDFAVVSGSPALPHDAYLKYYSFIKKLTRNKKDYV